MAVILKIMLFPFIWGFRGLVEIIENGIDEIRYGAKRGGKLFRILPFVAVLYTLGIGIYAYVKFIVTGGYSRVIDVVKEKGLLSLKEEMYTYGTSGTLYNSNLFFILMSLLLVTVVYMVIQFIKTESGFKNIIFIIITVVTIISETVLVLCATERIEFKNNNYYFVVMIVAIASAIAMYIVSSLSEAGRDIVRDVYHSVYSYLVFIPLVLFTLENVIGLGAIVLFMIIFLVVGSLIGGGALTGLNDSVSTSSSTSSSISGGGYSPKMTSSAKETKKTKDRINYLEKNIEENSKGLREYKNGSWSRGIVDEKLTMRIIESNRKEIERLKGTLE